MNQLLAMQATFEMIRSRWGTTGALMANAEELRLPHLTSMYGRAMDAALENRPFSEDKLGRWLGWMQAAAVANGVATFDEMKALNRRYADDRS